MIETSTEQESVPEILNKTFLAVDEAVNQREGKFSGCTAIVAYVKVQGEKVISYIQVYLFDQKTKQKNCSVFYILVM